MMGKLSLRREKSWVSVYKRQTCGNDPDTPCVSPLFVTDTVTYIAAEPTRADPRSILRETAS
jgi:hypothetical protein